MADRPCHWFQLTLTGKISEGSLHESELVDINNLQKFVRVWKQHSADVAVNRRFEIEINKITLYGRDQSVLHKWCVL
jgi:hypothetical protein